ncbi:MAG: histidine kinase [Bacteroidota bacterium]
MPLRIAVKGNLQLTTLLCILFLFCSKLKAQDLVYRHYSVNDGLPSSQVYTSLQDQNGYIWFSTERGVTRFNGHEFENFEFENTSGRNAIIRLHEDDQGKIWCSIFFNQLFYFEDGQFKAYEYNHLIKKTNHSSYIYFFHADSANTLWFGNRNRRGSTLYSISKQGHLQEHKTTPESIPLSYRLAKKNPSYIWTWIGDPPPENAPETIDAIRCENARVVNFTMDQASCTPFPVRRMIVSRDTLIRQDPVDGYQSVALPDYTANTMFLDTQNNLWLGILNHGAYCYPEGNPKADPKIFLPGKSVTSILEDTEGGYWFTTLYHGIYYLSNRASKLYTHEHGLPNNQISSIYNYRDTIYCGHAKGQISLLVPRQNEYVVSQVFDAFGNVYEIKPTHFSKGIIQSIVAPESHPAGFKIQEGRSSLYHDGMTYFINNSRTLHKVNQKNDTVKIYPTPYGERSLAYSEKYGLLLGTSFGLFGLEGDSFVPLSNESPLFKERIQKIKTLNSGWQVICSLGEGILFWNEKQLLQINEQKGLNSNICNNIFLENDSTIWVCTNKGINKILFQPEEPILQVTEGYTIANGLASNEILDITVDAEYIWAATRWGVNQIPRSTLKKNLIPPPVHITEIRLNANKIQPDQQVRYSENTLQVSFIGLSFRWPDKRTYQYRLQGSSDPEWKKTSQSSLTYSSLPPGRYTFEVRAINDGGTVSNTTARFPFTILRPFWLTTWFFITLGASILMLFLLLNRLNIRRVKRRAQLLKERDEFRNRSLRAQMNPHFIYNSLNTIQNFILSNDSKKSTSYLARFSRLMRMTFNHTNQHLISLKEELSALNLYTELEMARYPEKLEVVYNISSDLNTEKLFVPPLLLQPFIENAILHGVLPKHKGGTVTLTIAPEAENLTICIEDDGIGVEASQSIQRKKNGYYNQKHRRGIHRRRLSGMEITKARIAMLQEYGKRKPSGVQSFSSEDIGTRFQFEIPQIKHQNYDESMHY